MDKDGYIFDAEHISSKELRQKLGILVKSINLRKNGDSDNQKTFSQIAPYFYAFNLEYEDNKKLGGAQVTEHFKEWPRSKFLEYIPAYLAWLSHLHPDKLEEFYDTNLKVLKVRNWVGEVPKLPDPSASLEKYAAFICWSGDYGHALAKRIRQYFQSLPYQVQVFLSSEDINESENWDKAVQEALRESSSGLFLITQDSVDSAYLSFEYGALSMKLVKPTILLVDTPAAMLPAPLLRYQHKEFSREAVEAWIKGLFNKVEVYGEALDSLWDDVEKIREEHRPYYVTNDNNRWQGNVLRPLTIKNQNKSPYDLEQILKRVRQRLILVAQNHFYMTSGYTDGANKFWPLLKAALLRGVSIDIVCMHPDVKPIAHPGIDAPSGIDLWWYYQGKPDFFRHLMETWKVLDLWGKLYTEIKSQAMAENPKQDLGQLTIHGCHFTPLTMSMVDPKDEESRGFIVFSPRTSFTDPGERPQFIIRAKTEADVFDYLSKSIQFLTYNSNSKQWPQLRSYVLEGKYAEFDPLQPKN